MLILANKWKFKFKVKKRNKKYNYKFNKDMMHWLALRIKVMMLNN